MAPTLTVLVMCRNYAHYLGACLRSIFAAADQPCELVFVDNGSKDDSVSTAREVLREAPQHVTSRVVALDPELYLCSALNTALAGCRSDFIKVISADDMVGPNLFPAFRRLVETSEPRVGVWLAGSVIIDESGNVIRQTYSPTPFGMPDDGAPVYLEERHVVHNRTAPPFTAPSMFYRRNVYEDIGGYDERFRFEDRPFMFEVLKHGWKIAIHPYNNSFYRVHSRGISADPDWMAEARLPILYDHTLRAAWRNKPFALFHLARGVRVVSAIKLRRWRSKAG